MTPAPTLIPPELQDRAFLNSTAKRLGLGEKVLRGRRFSHPHHGVHVLDSHEPGPTKFLEERVLTAAREYLPLLRQGEVFSHTTALLLLGAPIETDEALHVTIPRPKAQARARNVVGHRASTPFPRWFVDGELPCAPPLRALVQSARLLPFRELVVAIDHLVLPRWRAGGMHPLIDLSQLREHLLGENAPGVVRVRAACEVARVGAESRYETLTRFELARMGLDTLELQAILRSPDGDFIGRFDLADRRKRKIIEFDGEQHRSDRTQYLKDIRRLSLAADDGYRLLRLHRERFRHSALVGLRAELCAFLGEPPQKIPRRLARYFDEPYHR